MSLDQEAVILKMLVANSASGTVIGKGGANLQEVQAQTGVQLRMSQQNEVLDSGERILTMIGHLDAVCTAQQLVTRKLIEWQQQLRNGDVDAPISLKILVPNAAVGILIGKGGIVIKELMTETGCRIQVSQVSQMLPLTQERIVSIEGTEEAVASAHRIVTAKLFEAPSNLHPQLHSYKELAAPKHNSLGGLPPPNSISPFGGFQQNNNSSSMFGGSGFPAMPPQATPPSSLQLRLPNHSVGGLIGKAGSNIKEISQTSGAKLQITQRTDNLSDGTDDRIITITGSMESVARAHYLVSLKLQQIQMQMAKHDPQ